MTGINSTELPLMPKNLDGRAGRGDTCFLSYITRRMTHSIDESIHYAAALTSLKMEKPLPFTGTMEDVLERMKDSEILIKMNSVYSQGGSNP